MSALLSLVEDALGYAEQWEAYGDDIRQLTESIVDIGGASAEQMVEPLEVAGEQLSGAQEAVCHLAKVASGYAEQIGGDASSSSPANQVSTDKVRTPAIQESKRLRYGRDRVGDGISVLARSVARARGLTADFNDLPSRVERKVEATIREPWANIEDEFPLLSDRYKSWSEGDLLREARERAAERLTEWASILGESDRRSHKIASALLAGGAPTVAGQNDEAIRDLVRESISLVRELKSAIETIRDLPTFIKDKLLRFWIEKNLEHAARAGFRGLMKLLLTYDDSRQARKDDGGRKD